MVTHSSFTPSNEDLAILMRRNAPEAGGQCSPSIKVIAILDFSGHLGAHDIRQGTILGDQVIVDCDDVLRYFEVCKCKVHETAWQRSPRETTFPYQYSPIP